MELLQLRYFMHVAKCVNMSQAAKELHIAQPAISQSISRLEKELSVKLFERQGRGIRLSEAGQLLKTQLEPTLSVIESIPEIMRQFHHSPIIHITVKVLSSSSLLPQIMTDFRKEHPQVEFTMLQQNATKPFDILITSVASEEEAHRKNLDVCLVEEIGVAVPLNSQLNADYVYDLKELAHEPFIGLEKGTPFREITDAYCQHHGFVPNYIFESDTPSTVRKLLKQGSGVGFYPHKTWGVLPPAELKWVTLRQQACKRYICLGMNQSNQQSELVRIFYSVCRNAIHSLQYDNLLNFPT